MILAWMLQHQRSLFNALLGTSVLRRHLTILKISAHHRNIVRQAPQMPKIVPLENIATHLDYPMGNRAMEDTSVKEKPKFLTPMTPG